MIVVTVVGIAIILIFISNLYAFLMGSLIITFGNFEMAIIFIFINEFYAFLKGSLIITLGNFLVLLMKYKGCLSE